MLLKILLVGAVLFGAMAAVKQGTVLRDVGLLSRCSGVAGQPMVESCSKGRLDGFPDLTPQSCQMIAARHNRQFWRCAAPVVSSHAPSG
jgi:hypothetical protein